MKRLERKSSYAINEFREVVGTDTTIEDVRKVHEERLTEFEDTVRCVTEIDVRSSRTNMDVDISVYLPESVNAELASSTFQMTVNRIESEIYE